MTSTGDAHPSKSNLWSHLSSSTTVRVWEKQQNWFNVVVVFVAFVFIMASNMSSSDCDCYQHRSSNRWLHLSSSTNSRVWTNTWELFCAKRKLFFCHKWCTYWSFGDYIMYDVWTVQTETMMAKQSDCKLGQPSRLTVWARILILIIIIIIIIIITPLPRIALSVREEKNVHRKYKPYTVPWSVVTMAKKTIIVMVKVTMVKVTMVIIIVMMPKIFSKDLQQTN